MTLSETINQHRQPDRTVWCGLMHPVKLVRHVIGFSVTGDSVLEAVERHCPGALAQEVLGTFPSAKESMKWATSIT